MDTSDPRKVARAALVKGGLSGLRWLYRRAAGPASQGTGLGSKVYNRAIRPTRAVLLPNLGKWGNRIRMGGAAHSLGHALASADDHFIKQRERILQVSKDLPPETREMIEGKTTRLGALRSLIGTSADVSLEGRVSDDAIREGVINSFRDGAKKHRGKVYSGKTLSSYLNPIGSRVLSSAVARLPGKEKGMEEYAKQFSTRYKDFLEDPSTPEKISKVTGFSGPRTAIGAGLERFASGLRSRTTSTAPTTPTTPTVSTNPTTGLGTP